MIDDSRYVTKLVIHGRDGHTKDWFKVIEMLQQNWAIIESGEQETGCTIHNPTHIHTSLTISTLL